jgi:hypothetical protein
MAQTRPILNVNSNFERGNIDGFTEDLTSATATFLDRRDDRKNPKRAVFPAQFKASNYIHNGRFARRYSIASGGEVNLTMGADPTIAVDPGMVITVGLVYRYNSAPAVFAMEIRISNAAGDPIAYVFLDSARPRYVPGNPFPYQLQVGATAVDLKDVNQDPTDYWERLGFTIEIPAEAAFMNPLMALTGPASATILDVGEFSMQPLDDRIHAGG